MPKERAGRAGLCQSLLKAKDVTEVMRLHSEYVQGRCGRWRSRPVKWPDREASHEAPPKPKT